MRRIFLAGILVGFGLVHTLFSAERAVWTFTEEQIRLFVPPLEAEAEQMLEWAVSLERPIPRITRPWGGYDAYREQVQLIKIMICRAILATDPAFALEERAWLNLWFPHYFLAEKNPGEWLPKKKAVYEELAELSRQKGEVLDQQTLLYLRVRELFLRYAIEEDKDSFSLGEKLYGEVDHFMKNHRQLDETLERLYSVKTQVLRALGNVEEKYRTIQADFKAEMKEFVLQNEDRLPTPFLFHLLYPADPYDTPEKQAEAYRLIEKLQKLIDTNDETKRFDSNGVEGLYNHQISLFWSLVDADEANFSQLLTYLEALEKKNDPRGNDAFSFGYRTVYTKKLRTFRENGGSNDDLVLIFDAVTKMLDSYYYSSTGSHVYTIFLRNSPDPFEQCTLEQRVIFLDRLGQVIAKMELMEKAWKEAGQGMDQESYVKPLQDYYDSLFLRMSEGILEKR